MAGIGSSSWPPRWLVIVLINGALLSLAAGQLWDVHQRQGLIDGLISCGATVQRGQVVDVTNVSSSGEPLAVDVRFEDGTTDEVEIGDSNEIANNQVPVRRCPDGGLAVSEADFSLGKLYADAIGTALLLIGISMFATWLTRRCAPPGRDA